MTTTSDSGSIVLLVDGLALQRDPADGAFRIRDIELAERLGYDRPRDIRKLISSMVEGDELPGIIVRASVARSINPKKAGSFIERRVDEYWLDRIESLLVVMKSKTTQAAAMCRVMATVFDKVLTQYDAYQRGLLQSAPAPAVKSIEASAPIQARIGDDPRVAGCLRSLLRAAASTTGRTQQDIQGKLRKPWGLNSVYRVALSAYDRLAADVQQLIDDGLEIRRLPAYARQAELPFAKLKNALRLIK